MNHRGWLLDSYIEERDAILWLKKDDGETIRLLDTHKTSFIAKPTHGFLPADVSWLFERHPYVHSSRIVERYSSLSRDKKIKVIEVKADEPRDLKKLIKYGRSLPEVEEIYNIGLAQIQWHLIELETPPSSLCQFSTRGDRIDKMMRLDDDDRLEPPPFSVLELRMPDSGKIEKIKLIGDDKETVIEGNEKRTIIDLMEHLQNSDPDIVSTPNPKTTLQYLLHRVKQHSLDLSLGRKSETIKGRVLVSTRSLYDMGVAGLSERARFTYAPMGISHDWEAGKTIDSRQCAEALKMGVIIPPMRGGYAYSSWAWDLIKHDKGGIVFSPKPGLHVNVAALDFESMFPNIIVRKNISYETVTEDGVDQTLEGFLGKITEPFLARRLRFKHQMAEYPVGSPEWNWCKQRQSTLKLFLVVYYGYSGCYANRFANVRVFQEINRQARDAMVKALGVAQRRGYEVVYGPFDSLFVKHPEATADDFRELAAEISRETELPMAMERHFRYLVLLNKTTDPLTTAANHYYGKLTDGLMFYRGIEVRRHDTPPYIHRVQEKMIKALLKPDDPGRVLLEGLAEAQRLAGEAIKKLKRGEVDPRMLVISKRLRRDLNDYSSNQPHIVAAMLGKMEEMSRYILVNTKNTNPFMRVMPEHMIDQDHQAYDRRKYASMMRRAAWNILRPFIPDEDRINGDKQTIQKLDAYI